MKDAGGNTERIELTLNTSDGIPPEWMNAKDFPTTLAQLEVAQVQLVFNEPIIALPTLTVTGFAVLSSALSTDGRVVTLRIQAQATVGRSRGVFAIIDLAGNLAEYQFTTEVVDKTPPALTLQSRPGSVTRSKEASFVVASSEGLRSLEYSTDGAASWTASARTDLVQITGLTDGTQQIRLRGLDLSGNRSSELAYTWMVDSVAPPLQGGQSRWSGVQGGGQVTQAPLSFGEALAQARWVEVSGSGITLGPVRFTGATVSYDMSFDATTPPGIYTFSLRVEDEAGNEALIPITLTVDKKNTVPIA